MLIFTLLGCPTETVGPTSEVIEVRAWRWTRDMATEPVGGALIAVDDAEGDRMLGETNNGGDAHFDVNPKRGPFTITVLSYANAPHAITRMGMKPADSPVEFSFDAKDELASTVTLSGVAMPLHKDTTFSISAHPWAAGVSYEGTGRPWTLEVPADTRFVATAGEFTHVPGARGGEFLRNYHRWWRFPMRAMSADADVALDLTHPVDPEVASANLFVPQEFVRESAGIGGAVYSSTSGYTGTCGRPTLAARHHEGDGWYWAMEWLRPTEGEDVATSLYAYGDDGESQSVRFAAPDAIGNPELLPTSGFADTVALDEVFVFDDVPADALPVIEFFPFAEPNTPLWHVEGPLGEEHLTLPALLDDEMLPDIDYAVSPVLIRRDGVRPGTDYDISWGEAAFIFE